MSVALPIMPLLHAGATGSEQDRWDLFGLALITLAFLLVTWVLLDVISSTTERERPNDERTTAPQPSRRAVRLQEVAIADTVVMSHSEEHSRGVGTLTRD